MSGLYVLAEYLYNGNALGFGRGRAGGALGFFQESNVPVPRSIAPGHADLLGHSRVVSAGEHLTGMQLGYDLLADLWGELRHSPRLGRACVLLSVHGLQPCGLAGSDPWRPGLRGPAAQ